MVRVSFRFARRAALILGGSVAALSIAVACAGPAVPGGATPAPGATTAPAKATATAPAKAAAPKVPTPANAAQLRTLSGNITVDGSSTVYPVTAAAAEEFRKFAPNVRATVGISGTGGGFQKFCNNETDISNASRPIRPTERQACEAKGIEFIELPVAYDGLSVVVHPQNTWATCLTKAELKKIWEPEAQGRITNWSQVRQGFPDRPLRLFGAGSDSGTFDYFTEAINGREKASRGDFQASEDDNVLVQGVAGDINAMGFFGYAYVVENPGKIKAIAIDDKGDGKCVAPSFETIANGTYQPLSRPIFIYVKKSVANQPQIQEFVRFYLSKSFTPLIPTPEVGYVQLSDQLYEAVTRRFNAGTVGTLWPSGAEVGATLDRYLR